MKFKYGTLFCLLIGLVLVAGACSPKPPLSTPTNTPLPPTDTPVPPTDTPIPPTDTLTPTITPNLAATQSAEAALTMDAMSADVIDQLAILDISTENGKLAWVQTDPVSIENTGYWEPVYGPFAEGVEAADFVVKVDISWDAPSFVGCGIILRSESPDPENWDHGDFYWFYYQRFSGAPGWNIAYIEAGEKKYYVTGDWRYSGAINSELVATNTFVIVVRDNEYTLFANGERVGRYIDDSRSRLSGYFGSMIVQDTGTSTCTFENGWIWVYNE